MERPSGYFRNDSEKESTSSRPPHVKLTTDRQVYRPGDAILATIEVSYNEQSSSEYVLLENLIVELKGLEKLDPQWLLTPEPARGSKQRRGERTILESSPTSIISDVPFEQGAKKTYLVRTVLPKVLPPSYKGTVVRYLYYLMLCLHWSVGATENGHSRGVSSKAALSPVEIRTLLNIWSMPNNSGLSTEDPQLIKDYWGIVPQSTVHVEIFWKEKNDENDWTRASDVLSEIEDEDISQTTESAFPSPDKRNLVMPFERMLHIQSPAATPKASLKESLFRRSGMFGGASRKPNNLTTLAVDTDSEGPDLSESHVNHLMDLKERKFTERKDASKGRGPLELWPKDSLLLGDTDFDENFNSGNYEHEMGGLPPSPSGPYGRRKSYNIRFDDQILARFSPSNPDSTYYFGDVVGGVLSFYHDGPMRCLEISAILETREVLNPMFIHPSRKNSPVITKVQADYYEVVVDMLQTHFVFSIPCDGPPSFTTPHVSLQWVLRFEFVSTSRTKDWTQFEHPLLVEEREKGEWSIPIVVHAPLPRTKKAKSRRERSSSPRRDSFGESANTSGRIPPLFLPPSSELLLRREEHTASSSFNLM